MYSDKIKQSEVVFVTKEELESLKLSDLDNRLWNRVVHTLNRWLGSGAEAFLLQRLNWSLREVYNGCVDMTTTVNVKW